MAILENTVDTVGDVALTDSLINRTITELNDDIVETINVNAFYGCDALTNVSFANVNKITNSSFNNCSGLKVADFSNLTSIGQSAFIGCNNLKSLILRNPNVIAKVNYELGSCGIGKGGYVYVPSALVDSYKSASVWKDYSDYIRAIEDYPEICSYLGKGYKQITSSSSDVNNPKSVYCYNNLIIVGAYTALYYSEDGGETWKKGVSASNSNFHRIKHYNGLLVAGSYATYNSNGGLYYSEDGKTWTKSNISGTIYNIIFANDIWVTVCRAGLYYSEDGKTWTKSNIDRQYFNYLAYGNGVFVAKDMNSSILYYSEDGKTWSEGYTECSSCNGLIYANGTFIAIQSSYLYTSTDGKTWSKIALSSLIQDAYNLQFIHYVNNKFFINTSGALYCSDDLITFQKATIEWGKRDVVGMIYVNHVYVAHVGSSNDSSSMDGQIYGMFYSFDGLEWHRSNITSATTSDSDMIKNNSLLYWDDDNNILYSTPCNGGVWVSKL